ncbi:MAG: hypothetical protein JNK48_33625 [Bryobacterales bacterium]|nr:hypothetical protein [Bryobacterales bacterium]
MAIYTCFDMVRDCRDNRPEGWTYLITNYAPILRRFLTQYYDGRAGLLDRMLPQLKNPQSTLWAAPGHAEERIFVAALRQELLRLVELDKASREPSIALDLETLTSALAPFTVIDRQYIWLESMGYSNQITAEMMNLDVTSSESARARAEEALRGVLDQWKRGLIAENGLNLGRLATASHGERCLPAKAFLDTLDGRITWQRKKDYEFHLMQCWFCIDHFCRIREADFAINKSTPLTEDEAAPLLRQLSIPIPKKEKKGLLARMFAR